MENRLELNKRPEYILPDEVIIGEYRYSKDIKRYCEPRFEPDICIGAWGASMGKIQSKKEKVCQIWINTKNTELINFIKNIDLYINNTGISSKSLSIWKVKKIILEEFYNKNNR